MVALDELIPYARNSRLHSEAQVAEIAASMREFGFTAPVLIADNGILAGHGRVMAARKLRDAGVSVKRAPGWLIPCDDLSYLSAIQRKAYVLADNRIALNSTFDEKMLKLEMGELSAEGFDLSITGFTEKELSGFLDGELVPIDAEAGESRSGVQTKYLTIGGRKVPMTDDEDAALATLLERYTKDHGMQFGFAAWLAEGRADSAPPERAPVPPKPPPAAARGSGRRGSKPPAAPAA